jgi:hypothetical protein
MNKLVEAIIDIYGQVGDFHITPFDGAIPVSEADEQAEKAVKVYTDAILMEAHAEIERLRQPKTVTVTVVSAADGKTVNTFKINPAEKTIVRPEHSLFGYVFEPEGDAND